LPTKLTELTLWHQQLAKLISMPKPVEFMPALMSALRQWFNYDTGIVFLFNENQPINALYDDYPAEGRDNAIAKYIDGMYLLDPFYSYFDQENDNEGGVWFMSQMAPDAFEETEFYQAYYQDLSIKDELCIFLPLKNKQTIVLSFVRRHPQGSFSTDDAQQLATLIPLLISLFDKLELCSKITVKRNAIHNAFESFGDEQLTPRERQIARLILQGHSSKSLAKELGISPSTVKVHRKHIYERLTVNTQTELFMCFINHLEKLVD